MLALVISFLATNPITASNNLKSENKLLQSDSIMIYDFSDFIYKSDSIHVNSTNAGETITFHYNGSSSNLERDVFIYVVEDAKNCSDFVIQFDVDYNYSSPTVFASFAPYFNSFYNEIGSVSNTTLGYIELQDSYTNNYGQFHIVSYPDDTADDYLTSSGSMGQNGSIQMRAIRYEGHFELTIVNRTSDTIILEHSWDSGISKPLNYIDLWFRGGYTTGNATISLSNLNMQLNFTETPITSPPPSETTPPTTSSFSFTIGISYIELTIITIGSISIVVVISAKRKKR